MNAPDGATFGASPLTCLRKRKYDNEALARSAIFNMRARGQDADRLRPYRCEYCDHWHLGRLPPTLVSRPLLRDAT